MCSKVEAETIELFMTGSEVVLITETLPSPI